MSFDRQKPYNDLPLLPPAIELETKAVLKQVIAARTALAELTGAAKLLPNQGVLIQAIGLQENVIGFLQAVFAVVVDVLVLLGEGQAVLPGNRCVHYWRHA